MGSDAAHIGAQTTCLIGEVPSHSKAADEDVRAIERALALERPQVLVGDVGLAEQLAGAQDARGQRGIADRLMVVAGRPLPRGHHGEEAAHRQALGARGVPYVVRGAARFFDLPGGLLERLIYLVVVGRRVQNQLKTEVPKQDNPLGRVMEPRDLLGTFCYLLSDDSSFVSGQTILVNGGSEFS